MRNRKQLSKRLMRTAREIFEARAIRFQSECGWCSRPIGEDDSAYVVGAEAIPGIDLSEVQGKVIEMFVELSGPLLLAAVAGFESDAKKEGKDILFLTCSASCGRQLKAAISKGLRPS